MLTDEPTIAGNPAVTVLPSVSSHLPCSPGSPDASFASNSAGILAIAGDLTVASDLPIASAFAVDVVLTLPVATLLKVHKHEIFLIFFLT
jgi:hypothetical protein